MADLFIEPKASTRNNRTKAIRFNGAAQALGFLSIVCK